MFLALALALAACSNGEAPRLDDNEVVVTGTLVALDDQVPADGGLTLAVEARDGTRTAFHIPSFFTPEPIPPGRWELYQHVKTFSVGESVRATGEPAEGFLLLRSLERLDGS